MTPDIRHLGRSHEKEATIRSAAQQLMVGKTDFDFQSNVKADELPSYRAARQWTTMNRESELGTELPFI